jgi:hypothetical protein
MTPADPIHAVPTRVTGSPRPVHVNPRPKDPFHPSPHVRVASLRALGKSLLTSLRFLMETEVHVYAFAVAVNIFISFYPFLVAMILICRRVLNWKAASDVIIQTLCQRSHYVDERTPKVLPNGLACQFTSNRLT